MAQNDVEEFLLERMQSPKGLGDVMASVGEGLACHPRGAREDSVFYLLCSFEMFPLHGEQNPQDVRLPGEKVRCPNDTDFFLAGLLSAHP